MQIQRVDAEILTAVRAQSSSGARARTNLTAARAAIEELFGRIREIQRKAEQSELMVQEICRDIKKLDYAKKHLTATITALRRLSMLVNAVGMMCLRPGQGLPARGSCHCKPAIACSQPCHCRPAHQLAATFAPCRPAAAGCGAARVC
jgi:hypothetical protein